MLMQHPPPNKKIKKKPHTKKPQSSSALYQDIGLFQGHVMGYRTS